MKIEIKSFAESGDIENERIVLSVLEDDDVGRYAIFRSKKGGQGGATSGSKDAYWFPDRLLKAGDLVVLYTKAGQSSRKKLESGGTVHFFYWHKSAPFWGGDSNNLAVLLEIHTHKTKVP